MILDFPEEMYNQKTLKFSFTLKCVFPKQKNQANSRSDENNSFKTD